MSRASFNATQQHETGTFASDAPRELQGVGGWLLLFLVGITFLLPLRTIVPYFLTTTFSLGGLIDVAVTSLGLLAALLLWREHPEGLDLLRIYFGVAALLAIVSLVRVAMLSSGFEGRTSMAGECIQSLLFVLIWFLYFRDSVRVHATYGRNL